MSEQGQTNRTLRVAERLIAEVDAGTPVDVDLIEREALLAVDRFLRPIETLVNAEAAAFRAEIRGWVRILREAAALRAWFDARAELGATIDQLAAALKVKK